MKVLVTGASGFIAKHIIKELLANDHEVRASTRSDYSQEQVAALFPGLEFVRLDLNHDDGWAEAMTGIDALIHTASPFPGPQPNDRAELIRPAVDGTRRALSAAQGAGVQRVVLTSSCAAIYKDSSHDPTQPSTRENWTDADAPSTTAYEASKTLAERAAWDFVAEHPEMKLTVINPGAVLGTPLDKHYGTSLEYVEMVLTGGMPMLANIGVPVVDVRDVARMHVIPLTNRETIGQRFPANAGTRFIPEIAALLKQHYPDRKISTRVAPNWLLRVAAVFNPMLRLITSALGRNPDVIATDAPTEMGFTYIPPEDAILASASYLLDH